MHSMPSVKLDPSRSLLVVIDIQPSLSKTIFEIDRVLTRVTFLAKVAQLLKIPVLATEQNPSRMGHIVPEISPFLGAPPAFEKMAFSALGAEEFADALNETERTQVVLVGLETHICVSQTAEDLLRRGFQVVVCPDAVSSRTLEAHKLGMERMRDAGIVPAHTESVAYEWMGTADHSAFKQFLTIVKEQANS
jgi:nicotinamidase-related amidase